jgi:cytosine/adenosine deaminase-related metal-dependent hydrolase
MTIHIKGAKIIAMDAAHGSETFDGDIVIEGQRIIAMGAALPETQADIVIDGHDKLVTPGFVNAHIHTPEALFRGRYENLPLEMWMTLAYYLIGDGQLAPRAIYLRSMLIAMDALRNGVTFMADDILEPPLQTMETLGSVFQAYDDAGIRANVSGHVIDRPIADTIPFFNEIVPDDLLQQVNAGTPPTVAEYVAFAEEAFSLYHGRADGRLRFMVAPSGPQRCTVELMEAADGLAQENSTAFHTHILESKMQAVAGQEFYGKTLVQYMHHDCSWCLGHRRGYRAPRRSQMLGGAQYAFQHEALIRRRADPQTDRRRCQCGARHGRHFDQRHAAHVRCHARRRPSPQYHDSRLRRLAERP